MAGLEVLIVHLRGFSRDHRELVWLASTSPRLRDALWLERAQCFAAIAAWKRHEAALLHKWQEEYDYYTFHPDREVSTDSESEYPHAFNGPPPPMHRLFIYAGLPGPPPMMSLPSEDY